MVSAPVDGAISGLSVQNGSLLVLLNGLPANDQKLRSARRFSARRAVANRVCYRHCCLELADKAAGPEGDIFAAHKMILKIQRLTGNYSNVWQRANRRIRMVRSHAGISRAILSGGNLYLREREADIRDLTRQVLNHFAG